MSVNYINNNNEKNTFYQVLNTYFKEKLTIKIIEFYLDVQHYIFIYKRLTVFNNLKS